MGNMPKTENELVWLAEHGWEGYSTGVNAWSRDRQV